MLKIGLTGGIASGKSTVASLFETHGVPVIYADRISREVVAPSSEGLESIRETFGVEFIDESGELNRAALRELIFSNPEKKELLESILHPLIRRRSDELESKARTAGAPYVVFEIPLLLETGRHLDMDKVLVVDVSEETQLSRVMTRDGSDEEQAIKILAAQVSRSARLAIADDVLSNEGEIADLESAVAQLHQKYLSLSSRGGSATND